MSKPIKSYSEKGVQLAVWEKERDGKINISYSIKKAFKDKNTGSWKESNVFFREDLRILRDQINAVLMPRPLVKNNKDNLEPDLDSSIPMSDSDIPF